MLWKTGFTAQQHSAGGPTGMDSKVQAGSGGVSRDPPCRGLLELTPFGNRADDFGVVLLALAAAVRLDDQANHRIRARKLGLRCSLAARGYDGPREYALARGDRAVSRRRWSSIDRLRASGWSLAGFGLFSIDRMEHRGLGPGESERIRPDWPRGPEPDASNTHPGVSTQELHRNHTESTSPPPPKDSVRESPAHNDERVNSPKGRSRRPGSARIPGARRTDERRGERAGCVTRREIAARSDRLPTHPIGVTAESR